MNGLLEDRYCIFLFDETCNLVPVYRSKWPIFRRLPRNGAVLALIVGALHCTSDNLFASPFAPSAIFSCLQLTARRCLCRIAATISAELKFFKMLLFCPLGQNSCHSANFAAHSKLHSSTMETLSQPC
ncbi:hypothetical protein ACFFKC_14145 [Pseudoduganella danionis]|uniref:Uncharacterized protein n=1 Tax=Pseudoduganella danionis TaxID=1890295 RepID=A0ABW9SN58_9BURK|nr:hypothetical protein [Pseudoduganella danionis]MTW33034.1 hypothetical protein [Pseudoduganella danionis]